MPVHLLGGLVCFGRVGARPPLLGLLRRAGITRHLALRARPLPRPGRGPGLAATCCCAASSTAAATIRRRCAALVRSLVVGKVAQPAHRAAPGAARPWREHAPTRRAPRSSAARATPDRHRPPGAAGPATPTRCAASRARRRRLLRRLRPSDPRRRAGLALPRPLAPSAARPGQRAALVPLHAAHPRLPLRAGDASASIRPSASCTATARAGPALALDLMEEFRPVLADRLALSLVNRRQLAAQGLPAAARTAPCC